MDLGGTKADAVLFQEDGKILEHLVLPGGIPFEMGVEASLNNAIRVVRKLLEGKGVTVSALYCAIAAVEYYQTEFETALQRPFRRLRLFAL